MLKHNQHNGAQIQSNTLFLSYVQKIVSRIFSNIRATQGGCTSSSDKSTSSIRRNVPLGLVKNPALSGFIEMVKLYWTRSWNYSAETILLPWRLPGRQVSALAAHTQVPLRIQQISHRLQYNTPSWFTSQPPQPTNKPATQLSAHNLMSRPTLGLQTPISWQEVGNISLLCGIEPGLYRCKPFALTTMLLALILRQFEIF